MTVVDRLQELTRRIREGDERSEDALARLGRRNLSDMARLRQAIKDIHHDRKYGQWP